MTDKSSMWQVTELTLESSNAARDMNHVRLYRNPRPMPPLVLLLASALLVACTGCSDPGSRSDGWSVGSDAGATQPDASEDAGLAVDIGPDEVVCGDFGEQVEIPPADNEALVENCDVFLGSFTVRYYALVDNFAFLARLRVVGGSLRLSGVILESLRGVEQLEYIGGNLSLQLSGVGNDPPIQFGDLSEFSNLRRVDGRFSIGGSDVTSLHGLENLHHVGALHIQPGVALRNLEGLGGLETVDGDIDIDWNSTIEDLFGLTSLREVNGGLVVGRNDVLESLRGLESIRSLDRLSIRKNPNLRSLDGLAGLEHIRGDLTFEQNESLSEQEIQAFIDRVRVDGEIIRE